LTAVRSLTFIVIILSLIYLPNNLIYGNAIVTKPTPVIKDPNLKVELVYQGKFQVQTNESSPVSTMTFQGNDILILNKNDGTIYRIINHTLINVPLLDVNVANKFERGLLGISTSNESKNNTEYVFVYYTQSKQIDGSDVCNTTYYCVQGTEPLGNNLYRYELKHVDKYESKLLNPKLLLNLPAKPAPSHNGGVLLIGPDNNLYLTIGDLVGSVNKSSSTMAQNIQDGIEPDGRAGILRVTQEGKPPSEGGLLGNEFPLNLYYAYGIRNSFGIDFDPVTGNLWDTENGPDYGDEINLVDPGFNSGWMTVQGLWKPVSPNDSNRDLRPDDNVTLSPTNLVDFGGKGNYSSPEFIWKYTVGPTAIKFLTSDKLGEDYQNDLFVGDNNLGNLYHFDLSKDRSQLVLGGALQDRVANSTSELDDVTLGRYFDGITDIDVGPDGCLYILTYKEDNVYIYRIALKEH
jgi:glucose/arabinose dehydrogenase